MANRTDLLTITLTRYTQKGWPFFVITRKKKPSLLFYTPIGWRWMGKGRRAIDTPWFSIIVECWFMR